MERAQAGEKAPKSWPAALTMFHIAMWRERMRDALAAAIEGSTYASPGNVDEINDAELPNGIGTPLTDAAARADHLLSEIAELLSKVGDKQIDWFGLRSAGDAVLRNSYSHARRHICEYLTENGDVDKAQQLVADALKELQDIAAPEYVTRTLTELKR